MLSAVSSSNLVSKIVTEIAQPLVYLLIAIATVYFLYGVVIYFSRADSSDERQTGAKHMMWGIVGLVIMISVLAIINFVKGSITELGGRVTDPKNLQIVK